MTVRTLWFIFALCVVVIVFVPKLMAQENYILQCNDGLCVVSQSVLEKLLAIIEHWKGQALTCKGA